jgi:hypothetical protein
VASHTCIAARTCMRSRRCLWTDGCGEAVSRIIFIFTCVRPDIFVDGLEESVGERGSRVVVALYVKVCMTLVLTCSKEGIFANITLRAYGTFDM